MQETVIRQASAADADDIAGVYLESARVHRELDGERYVEPPRDEIVARYRGGGQHPASASAAVTLVAELDGAVIGFVDARLERPHDAMHRQTVYVYIAEIAVACACQNRGVGERLMRAAEDWGRRMGAEFASLDYVASNERASRLYHARLGYRVASVIAVKRL
jgi:ribosomal protein S18 acetylase RimI-like enzyme